MKEESEDLKNWSKYAKIYDPIKCASIDGTDSEPHDRAVVRALNSTYKPNRFVKGHPECTIFVSRLNHETSKDTIKDIFSKYGKLKRFRLVKDIVTGMPKGYAFVEYEDENAAEDAYRSANKTIVDGNTIFVDFECERLLKGWKPRRLGGGFAGKKESGQLRFGGRDRPFKKPIALEVKEQEEKKKREKERRARDMDHHRRDKSRDRHRKKSPQPENDMSSSSRHGKVSKEDTKRSRSPTNLTASSRKGTRRHSPPIENGHEEFPPHQEKKSLKKDMKPSADSKQSEYKPRSNITPPQNDKEPTSENPVIKKAPHREIKGKYPTKQSNRPKSPRDNASNKSTRKLPKKDLPDGSGKHNLAIAQENVRHQSPLPQDDRFSQVKNRYSPNRARTGHRSPVGTGKRSPYRDMEKRRPALKNEKRPYSTRERNRSRSPRQTSDRYFDHPSRENNYKQNYKTKPESPSRKLRHRFPESDERLRSPDYIRKSPFEMDVHSPRRILNDRSYSPQFRSDSRKRQSPQRQHRSPGRRSSPHRTSKQNFNHYENTTYHDIDVGLASRYFRDSRSRSPVGRRSISPEYYRHRPNSPGQEIQIYPHEEYKQSHPFTNIQCETENQFENSTYTTNVQLNYPPPDIRQYPPPKVDFHQPPPQFEQSAPTQGNFTEFPLMSRDYPPPRIEATHRDISVSDRNNLPPKETNRQFRNYEQPEYFPEHENDRQDFSYSRVKGNGYGSGPEHHYHSQQMQSKRGTRFPQFHEDGVSSNFRRGRGGGYARGQRGSRRGFRPH